MWYKDAVFYEVYVRAFKDSKGDGHGDLRGLIEKLDYLQELGVTALWLLPIYPSPLKDDGYDIADFYRVHPDYGTLDDFKALIEAAHSREIRVITDLVLNHTSDQHPWFQAAREDPNSKYRDYYVWSDDDQKYADTRIIFLDTEDSNWTWDEMAGQYYWHRFFSTQPDLNYDNPEVQEEMLKILSFWLDLGIDGFRADAVPYLYEREGTNCENLPETHQYLKRVRAYLDENYPGRILLAEANQWPEDLMPYFGDGQDEFHMGFHFPLMPRLYLALLEGDRTPLEWILEHTPPLHNENQWCIFLRNHDELTLEMVTEEEREKLWGNYAPEPRMRLNLGIRRRLAPLMDNDQRKICLLYSMLFTFPGSPIVYYGDEIGMGDNIELFDRNGVRTPMQWTKEPKAGFSSSPEHLHYEPIIQTERYGPGRVNVAAQETDPNSLLNTIRHMIAIRKGQKAFGWGDFNWVDLGPKSIASYTRTYEAEKILLINNLRDAKQAITLPMAYTDLLTNATYPAGEIELAPYQYLWLRPL